MLRFAKKDVRSLYRVEDDVHTVGPLRGKHSWSAGSVVVDAVDLEFVSGEPHWVEVRRGSDAEGRATRDTARSLTWTFESAAPTFVITSPEFRRFEAQSDGVPVGTIELVGAAGRRIETDLPAEWPIAVRLLASFIAIGHWNRAASQ